MHGTNGHRMSTTGRTAYKLFCIAYKLDMRAVGPAPIQSCTNRLAYSGDWAPALAGPNGRRTGDILGGALEVPSGLVGTMLIKFSFNWINPLLLKKAGSPYMHADMGWIYPMVPSASLVAKWALVKNAACRWAVPVMVGRTLGNVCKKEVPYFWTPFS